MTETRAAAATLRPGTSYGRYLPLLLLALVVIVVAVAGRSGPSGAMVQAGVLVVFTILCWAFGLFAEPVASLVFFLLAIVFAVAKPAVVFSGFQSVAWWLIFGGSITGIAVQTTGLGHRLAGLLFGRAAGTYPRAVAAVALAALGLAFIMPSTTGRILILMPVVIAFAERLGLGPGRPGYTGLMLTAAAGSYLPATSILPANVPNTVLLGAAETIYGIKLTYGPYFLLHFPVLGALKTVVLVAAVCRLFPERGPLVLAPAQASGPMTRDERALVVILGAALALFATDFIHGISPAWISLGAGISCLLPGIGMVSARQFSERMNLVTLIYVAGFLGVGALVTESGLAAVTSRELLHFANLVPGHTTTNLAAIATIDAGLGLITTLPGLPAVLTPLSSDFSAATGLPVATLLMLQVVVFSTVFMPYQSPPMMIAMHLGNVRLRDGAKLTLWLAAITIALLIPLDYLWWRLLGWVA
ncbi:MAG TPA: SLC13 family permease [Stellaceae bacterium]|nr:SLC13 family permease [Stellaceae bacterium]